MIIATILVMYLIRKYNYTITEAITPKLISVILFELIFYLTTIQLILMLNNLK